MARSDRYGMLVRVFLLLLPWALFSTAADAAQFDGAQLGLAWGVPFVGILLSIAFMPLFAPAFWHHHYGKISVACALAFLAPFTYFFGVTAAMHQVAHVLLLEYLPFIIVLFALYTIAGGIRVHGNLHGAPGSNTALLAFGTFMASWIGTTGAAMLLIRPLIRANDNRKHNAHVVVFFIFLVANAGGALTPLGDPPLFLGFLMGVDFFWTTIHMFLPTVLLCTLLLSMFFVVDWYYFSYRDEQKPPRLDPTPDSPIRIEGGINLALLVFVIGAVLLSGFWRPGIAFELLGSRLELQSITRDVLLLVIALLSLRLTPRSARHGNDFKWAPMMEVAKLFIGIFLTIIPVIAILRSGTDGALGSLIRIATDANGQPINAMYFWLTGSLSAFLDNAPTYMVFFNMAGGDPEVLSGPLATTLMAISAGAVYMGAMTYIGNAPNFMVKAIAEHNGIRMPSFFGYMAWSIAFLLPCLILIAWIFF